VWAHDEPVLLPEADEVVMGDAVVPWDRLVPYLEPAAGFDPPRWRAPGWPATAGPEAGSESDSWTRSAGEPDRPPAAGRHDKPPAGRHDKPPAGRNDKQPAGRHDKPPAGEHNKQPAGDGTEDAGPADTTADGE
jgi:hypothetical protein